MLIGGEILEELRRLLNLNSYEARVYLSLLLRGAGRPPEIARRSGVPAQRVYDVLRSLRDKGFVVEDGGVYLAVNPREALRAYASVVVAEAMDKANQINLLAERLSSLAVSAAKEYVRVVTGIPRSIGEALALLERCDERPVFTTLKVLDRVEELWPFLQMLLKASSAKPLVLLPCNARLPRRVVEEAVRLGAIVKSVRCVPLDMLVACDTVIVGLPSTIEQVVTIVVKNELLADAMKKRISEIENESC